MLTIDPPARAAASGAAPSRAAPQPGRPRRVPGRARASLQREPHRAVSIQRSNFQPTSGSSPDPLEAARPVQRLARVVGQRDHRQHLVDAVARAAGRAGRRTAAARAPARARTRRGRPTPRGSGRTPAAGGTTRSRRSPPPRRSGRRRRAGGRRARCWPAGPPSRTAAAARGRRSRSRCAPARRRWPRFAGGRQDLRCAPVMGSMMMGP